MNFAPGEASHDKSHTVAHDNNRLWSPLVVTADYR